MRCAVDKFSLLYTVQWTNLPSLLALQLTNLFSIYNVQWTNLIELKSLQLTNLPQVYLPQLYILQLKSYLV